MLDRALAAPKDDISTHAKLLTQAAERFRQVGDLVEAERLLNEVKRHFEKLGYMRERAVTLGKIADILQARGEFDEALRIRREEVLPISQQMGVIHNFAYMLYLCAMLRTKRGVYDQEDLKIVGDESAESFAISRHLGQADFLAEVGFYFGQLLAASSNREAALTVLDEAAAAAEKLRWQNRVVAIRQLQEQIRASGG